MLAGHAAGKSREEIAAELGVAIGTVRIYEWQARKAHGVATLAEAVEKHRQAGMSSDRD